MISGLLGLRVDVDTHDGMRDGVPRLLDLTESQLPETEALSSQHILVKPIGSRRRSWFAAVTRLLFSRPNPLIIVAGLGQERLARWLSIGCVGCDCIVAPRVNNLIPGLRAVSADKSPSA